MSLDSPLIVFEFQDHQHGRQSLSFTHPIEIVVARTVGEVRPALRTVQRAVASGLYAAGYVAYEAAPAFDTALATRASTDLPLLWFGLFRAPLESAPARAEGSFQLSEWRPDVARDRYERDIATIRAAIERGETYQVNYTMRLRASFTGDDRALYRRLGAAQAAGYCAYLDIGRYRILSASPELFFRWREGEIVTRPMKGTAPRGRWSAEDQALADWLAGSEKNRAENLMIVDLLRNDIGRVAEVGSVAVPRLFEIERYPTVHQLTSTVTARPRPGTTLEEVFAALFPCGSITGAPKVQTMKLIAALEHAPRGIYCGAIGFVAPGGEAVFNVAIRTVTIDTQTGVAEYGVGGGITWDSDAGDEYAEALLKAAVLTESWPDFELLETLRLERGAYILLDRHIERLMASARYFGIPLPEQEVRSALECHRLAHGPDARRVRLLVGADGSACVESHALPPPAPGSQQVAFARAPVSRRNRFLFHKTTNRAVYEAARAERPGCFDVLLWNEEGEVTEFTTGNLVIERAGERWTPPLDCGLLAGTLRAELLDRGEIRERVLSRADVVAAQRCWLINSVRGWVPVEFVDVELGSV
jgi:para-aminobenzoate synthetase/4-amino-4-deoxychorismate lyase